MGLTSLVVCLLSINFITLGTFGLISNGVGYIFGGGSPYSNPLLVDVAARPGDAILMLVGGLVSALIAYLPLVEFGTRARPIAIDSNGLSNFLFGVRLRFLPWSEVRKIVKLRAQHPLGFKLEYVRIFGAASATHPQRRNEAGSLNANAEDAMGGWLKFLPHDEFWLPSYVDHKSFLTACKMLSSYAQLHQIPMEFWDMTLAERRNTSRQGAGAKKSAIVGVSIDHL